MSLQGIFIKQKLETLEIVTGCEIENKYNIYRKKEGKNKKKGKKLWKAKEKSGCFSRNCLSNPCRAFDIKIKNITQSDEDLTCLRV